MLQSPAVKRCWIGLATAVAVALLLSAASAWAQDDTTGVENAGQRQSSAESGRIVLFPAGHLLPLFIADPHRPAAAIILESYASTDIEQAGDQRFLLQVGGRFGLLRWLPGESGGRAWQLGLEAGLDAQFDIDNGFDNIGWEGNYGLSLTTARGSGRLAFLLGILHTSSHIGDEWIIRTDRERINYTREELRAAVGWRLAPAWRTYAEVAYGYSLGSLEDIMEPLRSQSGLEYEAPATLWQGRAGWYAALDLSAWEERDWRLDTVVQAGLRFPSEARTWRLGIRYANGRVPQGEYFQATESSLGLGLWCEL